MTAATDPQISVVFRRPFDEQVAFFRGKLGNLVPTATWRDLSKSQHDRGFMVAGAAKADLLADLAGAVDKAISEGETMQAFRTRFGEIVDRHGWHGWTGEGSKAGEAWRTRVIYETNLATSYSAGRSAQLEQGDYPYWMYQHSGLSKEPRPEHLAWDGLIVPADDTFWKTHTPPNGWGCKCSVVGVRSSDQARRLGGDPDKELPDGWNTRDAKGRLPGVDEGWDYKPGDSVSEAVSVAAQKTVQWDYRLAKQFMESVPEAQRDALATAIRTQPETGEAVRRYARRVLETIEADVPPYQTMGLLTTDEATRIAKLMGIDRVEQELFDWTLTPQTMLHVRERHGNAAIEAQLGQRPATLADYAKIPRLTLSPDQLDFDDNDDSLLMKKEMGQDTYVLAWKVLRGRRTVTLASMRIHHRQAPRDQRP